MPRILKAIGSNSHLSDDIQCISRLLVLTSYFSSKTLLLHQLYEEKNMLITHGSYAEILTIFAKRRQEQNDICEYLESLHMQLKQWNQFINELLSVIIILCDAVLDQCLLKIQASFFYNSIKGKKCRSWILELQSNLRI